MLLEVCGHLLHAFLLPPGVSADLHSRYTIITNTGCSMVILYLFKHPVVLNEWRMVGGKQSREQRVFFYFTLYILFLLFNWLMFDVGFGECFTSKYSPGLEYQYYWSNMFLFILLLLFSRSFSFQKFQNIFLQARNVKK